MFILDVANVKRHNCSKISELRTMYTQMAVFEIWVFQKKSRTLHHICKSTQA